MTNGQSYKATPKEKLFLITAHIKNIGRIEKNRFSFHWCLCRLGQSYIFVDTKLSFGRESNPGLRLAKQAPPSCREGSQEPTVQPKPRILSPSETIYMSTFYYRRFFYAYIFMRRFLLNGYESFRWPLVYVINSQAARLRTIYKPRRSSYTSASLLL